MARKSEGWSFNAGEKGKNWVRAYEDHRDGKLYVEWRESVLHQESGEPIIDPVTRRPKVKRVRLSLARFGITSRVEAKNKARELAEGFCELAEPASPTPLTLD